MAHSSPDFDFDFDSDMDKLTSKIFSILENDFLFGHKLGGKVRILSIDAQGLTDGILAATSLCHLESSLQKMTSDPDTRIADYFDVVAASGAGGILASLLFARGPDGRPLSTAQDALQFLLTNRRRKKSSSSSSSAGLIRRILISMGSRNKALKKKLGQMSLKDTSKAVLIPCYDLTTRAPFVFSRADAFESDAFDFKLTHVCSATTADDPGRPFHMRSVDKKTTILGVGCCLAADITNPTAVAITHVLNNKQEFPVCRGLDDLLILSLGNGQLLSPSTAPASPSASSPSSSHMVDEAVSMAFAECRSTNYVRIQGNCSDFPKKGKQPEIINSVEDMLRQKNAQSVLFRGKKLVNYTNAEILEMFATEVIKEHQRRKMDTLPTVLLKQTYVPPSPRTSSATNLSTFSSN